MVKARIVDYVLLTFAVVFTFGAILLALFYAPLVPTDVSVITLNPAEYTDYTLRVKGVVGSIQGGNIFELVDIGSSEFGLIIVNDKTLPPELQEGDIVIVTGELVDVENPRFESMDILLTEDERPGGWVAPYAQKIFYFHTPAAWSSYLAFGIVFLASILYLAKGDVKWDTIALSSAEIGVVFCTLAIITGPLWAKPEWGVYWRWEDTKLLTTFVMWMIYLGYISLRLGMEGRSVGRVAAVFGIIGFVAVPLSFISSRVWQSVHPNPVGTPGGLSPEAGIALVIGLIAMTFLYIIMLRKRIALEIALHKVEKLKEHLEGEVR